MTDNSRKVFDFLKANHGVKITASDIVKELGISMPAVTGSVNGLCRNKYAVREEVQTEVEGKTVVTKYISLTDAGMAFDPDAVVEKKAEAKAEG